MYRGVATFLVALAAFDYSTWTASISTPSKRQQTPCCTFSYRSWRPESAKLMATDLATQLLGTGWLTEGMAWDDQAKNPAGSRLSGTARDTSGRSQRFTKPLLAGADAAWSCERKARVR